MSRSNHQAVRTLAVSSYPVLGLLLLHSQQLRLCIADVEGCALQAMDSMGDAVNPDLHLACVSGITRTTLMLGDLRGGRQLALQTDNVQLWKECALILENMQQMQVNMQTAASSLVAQQL